METMNKSMVECMDYAQGRDNEVEIMNVNIDQGKKVSIMVMGKDRLLMDLDKDIKARRLEMDKGEGYIDYKLLIEEEPRNFVYNISSKYPELEFAYHTINKGL